MTNNKLASDAANAAVRVIQDALGVPDGDFAGIYFDSDRWATLTDLLAGYVAAQTAQIKEGR